MPKYRIQMVLEQGGYAIVDAETPEEARQIVEESVESYDFDELEVDITHRDFYTIDEEELEDGTIS